MNNARRWYIYLVCAISFQAASWAIIALLRNLLAGGGGDVTFIAFQIAVIVIALPIFLFHWSWAQRLAAGDINEREASLRRMYLYGMAAGFLGALVANAYSLMATLLWLMTGKPGYNSSYSYSPGENILYFAIAIIVLGLLLLYQQREILADAKIVPESGSSATVRRLYYFVFSAWGLAMITTGVIRVFRWILLQFGTGPVLGEDIGFLTDEISRLIIGLPLWLIFWRKAQELFSGAAVEERASALRKFYLYAVVFIAVLTAVTDGTIILAGLLRRTLGLPPSGQDILQQLLSGILGMALLWWYHAQVLRQDGNQGTETTHQGGVRRLYLYLVAGIGLAAFLVGLSGDLSVLIRSFSENFSSTLKEQLAWFTAALIAGLPVWLFQWRQSQLMAVSATPAGAEERRSTVRKNYLYFYLLLATLTVLSSAVYILYRLLSLALGESGDDNLGTSLGQSFAYGLVGVGIWLYHGSALRADGDANRREQAARMEKIKIVLMNLGDETSGQMLLDRLQKEMPGISPDLALLPPKAGDADSMAAQLAQADLIVGPWPVAVSGGNAGMISTAIAQAVVNSPARKILMPTRLAGWDWAGVDDWDAEAMVLQTTKAVKQYIEGEAIKMSRPMSVGGVIGTIIGVLFLLILLIIPILFFFL